MVAAHFCPVLFAAEPPGAPDTSATAVPAAPAPAAPAGGLPYRLVLAVATLDSIVRWPLIFPACSLTPGCRKPHAHTIMTTQHKATASDRMVLRCEGWTTRSRFMLLKHTLTSKDYIS